MSDDLDAQWEEWLSEGGSLIEKEIEEEIVKNWQEFSLLDGTHAKWIFNRENDEDDVLGVLLVFSPEEIADLITAWDDARDGDMSAGSYVASWLSHFFNFVDEACDPFNA